MQSNLTPMSKSQVDTSFAYDQTQLGDKVDNPNDLD